MGGRQGLQVAVVRGGTSRGVFVDLAALPPAGEQRDQLCRELVGSPDGLHLEGLGGGFSSNCKVMAVTTPAGYEDQEVFGHCPPGMDLVSVFAQVGVDDATVDWAGNCGNLTSAVSAFALEAGLLTLTGGHASVRVWNANTGSVFVLSHELVDGRLPDGGDCRISGVQQPGPRVDVLYEVGSLDGGGAFPAGPRVELSPGVAATVLDVANPLVVVAARDLGADVRPGGPEDDSRLLERLDVLRVAGAHALGIEPSAAVPRVALVAPGDEPGELAIRVVSLGRFHHACPVTAALALGAAGTVSGTVVSELVGGHQAPVLRMRHPKGTLEVVNRREGDRVVSLGLVRSARIVMTGRFNLGR